MAQPIYCDVEGEPHLADVLVSRIESADVSAWCDVHYIEVARAILDAVDAAERQATEADALARLGADGLIGGPDAEATEADAPILTAGGGGSGFPSSGDSSDAGDPPAEPPTKPAGGPRRSGKPNGTSPTPDVAPGPNLTAVGDPGEAGSAPR